MATAAVGGQVVQQFYVPFPETDFKASLQAIATGTTVSNQIQSTISIVVGATNTVVVYDHWEDGYENDLANPVQTNTLVWGDGITTNGVAPGYSNDLLPLGGVITLTNVVSLPRNPSVLRYDGRDRIGATRAITVARAGWATNTGTLLASSAEVYDTSRYGTYFVVPVGTNTTPAVQSFSYSSLHIIAAENGTVVQVDMNGDGSMDLTNSLNAGEFMFVNGGVQAGATVTASKPVQVHQLTGRVGSNYQSRTFAIRPVNQWDTSYYAPVGTTSASYVHNVFLYNPYLTNITVLYAARTNSGSFTVTNRSNYKFAMPLNSGARFYTTNGTAFYAVGCNDSGSSSTGSNQNYDWGYALLPAAALTPVVLVGWAPGSDDQAAPAGPDQNGSPVWVTPTKAATIYVNYSGNYNSGPYLAPDGHRYDTNYPLAAYQFKTIYNPTTRNMTGARIWTTDGTTFAAAWGEDAAVSGTGAPYIDCGAGIIPFPLPTMQKSSRLAVDRNGDGKPGWGDTLEYTVHVQNEGMLVLGNVLVLDNLQNTIAYVTNSTTLNGVPVADNLVPPAATAFPLDESGLLLPQIQVNGYSDIKYSVVISQGATSISNSVSGSAGGDPVTSSEFVVVAGPVTLAFSDASGRPVSSYVTNSGVYLTMTDIVQNTNASTVQTVTTLVTNLSNGDVESVVLTETGTNSGVFRNTTALPMSTTGGGAQRDGTLRALVNQSLSTGYTDPISGSYGPASATVTASPFPYTSKTSALVGDQDGNGVINWGDTVEYSILLTNAAAQAVTNLIVRDVLPANAAYVASSTTSNGIAVADSGATAFPLDESGRTIATLASGATTLFKFRVTVTSGTSLANSVTVTNLNGLVQAQDLVTVSPPPPSCSLNFTDNSGNPVSVCAENSGLYITMSDSSMDTNAATAQTVTVTLANSSTGDVESLTLVETGTNTGIFRNAAALPTSTVLGADQHDGTFKAAATQVASVAFTGSSGESCSAFATFVPAVQIKKLYLSDPAQSLDRVDPVATSDATTANTANLAGPVAATNATITVDSTSTGQTNASSLTFTHTTGAGSNRLLLVGVAAANQTVSSVTYNGVGLSQVAQVADGGGTRPHAEIWSLTNPASGTYNVVVTLSGSANVIAGATTFNGVSQTNTLGTPSTQVTASSITVTSAVNEVVFDSVCAVAAITPNVGQAQQWNLQQSSIYGGASTKPGAASVTMFWTNSASRSAFVAVPIRPAALAAVPGQSTAFTQVPAMCRDFTLAAGGAITLTGYVQVVSGSMPAAPAITATLTSGSTVIATLAAPSYDSIAGTLGWSSILGTNLTVPADQAIVLTLNNNQPGVTFNVQFDSASKPSALNLPTITVIRVDQLSVYDAAYPGGSVVTNVTIGQTAYVRASISDPFGSYDVTGLSVLVRDPGANSWATNLTSASVVVTNGCSKIYELPIPPSNWQGLYSIQATAYEGTEGITNLNATSFQAQFPTGGTPGTVAFMNSGGSPTNSYATNETVCLSVTDANMNLSPVVQNTLSAVIMTTSGDTESVTLTETGLDTGVFTGCINANTNTAVAGNGVLNAPGGANLTVTYTDPLNPADTSTATALVRMPPGPKPVVSLFKRLVAPANSTVLLDSPVQFDIEVANPGSVAVTNVTLTDTFPSSRLQFVSATLPPDSTTPAGTLTWTNLGPLLPGTNVSISAYFTAKVAGALTNSVSVTGTTNAGPVRAMATNNVSAIAVTKTLVSPTPGPAYINSNVVFRIAITNVGVNAITSYMLQDSFSSACFQFMGASVAPSGSGGGVILWTSLPGLAVGAGTSILVTNKVIGDCQPAVNNADVTSVLDGLGNAVPAAHSSTSITNLGASISGTVWYDANANATNDAGDSALASAVIYIDLNGDSVRQGNEPFAATDTNGVYSIVSIPAGSYGARVDTNSLHAGMRPTFDLDGTNTAHAVSLTISNGQTITGLDFGYVGSGSLAGTVWSDSNGDGLQQVGESGFNGVNVFLDLNANGVREVGEPYVTTASDGLFIFNYLVADTYRVAADILSLPAGLRPTFDLDGTNSPNTATVVLGAGQNVANANFGYQGRANIAGIVTDAFSGLPVPGVTIVVVDSLGTTQTVTTGLSGDYSFGSVWTGPASVTASKIGYGTLMANPSIAAGANTQNMVLTPNTLTGLVMSDDALLPIVGATVVVVDSANVTNVLSTDGAGHYGLTNIAAGPATVTVSMPAYRSTAASPTILTGANTLNVGLMPNSLSGVVTDAATGSALAGATVVVTDSSNAVHTVTTDAGGRYGVTNVPAGAVTVTASRAGYGSASVNATLASGANSQNLSLVPNTLDGIITNAITGLPIAGATVLVVDGANTTNLTVTDLEGYFVVSNLVTGPAMVSATFLCCAANAASPTIFAGANTQDLGLMPNILAGVARDALTALPLAGVTLSLVDHSNVVHTATTDADGRYGLTNITSGSASFTAALAGYGNASLTPTIVPGINSQDVSLTGNTLVGQVTDAATHQPLLGATVQVVDFGGSTNTLTTDAGGYYGLTNVPAGAATISVTRAGYNPTNRAPVIVAGSNALDFQLTSSTPTLALISSVKSFISGDAVLVRWQTASEVGSVSFDLYRAGTAPETWVKVNPEPVLAANAASGASYEVADLGVRPFENAVYRLVELEEQGTTRTYGPYELKAESAAPAESTAKLAAAPEAAKAATLAKPAAVAPTKLDEFTLARIATTNSGVVHVTAAALAGLLNQPQASLQAALGAGSLRLLNQGQPVAYLSDSDGFSFYAEPLKNNYTAQNIYCLSAGSAAPLATVEGRAGTPAVAGYYLAGVNCEQDLLAVPTLVQDPNQDFWMWQRLVAGLPMFSTAAYSFTVDRIALGASGAQLTVRLLGGSEAAHAVQIMLNGAVVGQDTWRGRAPHTTVLDLGAALLIEGQNRLTVKALANDAGATSQWYVNGFSLRYPRQYVARGGTLEFGANSNAVIVVSGFSKPAITVLDVTAPKLPVRVQNIAVSSGPTGYSATFAAVNPQGRYVAFEAGAGAPAASMTVGQTAGWANPANGADYLILAPDALADSASALAAYRQQRGLRAVVAPLAQIYNEFGCGIPTPLAIKRFLATATSKWSVKPRYAVLVGVGTYDYRDILQQHDNLLPPLLVPTSFGLFCSDSAYSDANEDGLPELAIGRLPVRTAEQFAAVLAKIKDYEGRAPASLARSLLLADAPDTAGDFASGIRQAGARLGHGYSNNIVECAGKADLAALRGGIQSSLNDGVDLVNYVGHGAIDRFGNAGYLTSTDVPALRNGSRLPVVVAVTCVAGQFSVPGSTCLAQSLLLQSQGGAVAVIAPTGLSINKDASRLNLRLMSLLPGNPQAALGDLFRQAMTDHITLDKPLTEPAIYNLIGDPATTYNVALSGVAAPAPTFTGAVASQGSLVLTWSGGRPPYQLEIKSSLRPDALWQALGEPVENPSATVSLGGQLGFLRVRCNP